MDIKKAIERVSSLKEAARRIDKAIERSEFKGYGRPVRVSADVYVEEVGSIQIMLDKEDCIALLRATKNKYEAEISKLQPIIDMANAALKGVLS
ncbi:hypothetical protein [Neopusillimonas aromaticivorans]|uniref:hypothetical protein n=1 Tax=Neopusillimonas aromaticivorans TaxID=2979868 RepID=UPI002599A114|nr:hypothetical protein [Neopusillimonas aromaticivorans]WJJ93409.1 hypothetical protein N7E01_15820 [Neopusillimonas aromaticivorans]